jgi:asparagine synthase (glutamine-hydrolysing)
MAAIAGWMALPRHAPDDSAMAAVLQALAHRGPQAAGACALSGRGFRVVMGQRQGVAQGSSRIQPSCDEAAGIALALDGEVCNLAELRVELERLGHRFGSGRDGDVLLRAYQQWDKDLVQRLRGPFALAVWDGGKQRLMLARDRFGEKPLYWCESNGSVFFASEIKGLLRIPGIRAETDLHAVREFLEYGYVPGPRTLFSGIRKLPPGACSLWQFGRRREARYWRSPDRDAPAPGKGSTADAVSGFLSELETAVKLRMGRERQAGVFLSGGIDSAVLAGLVSRQGTKLTTFSLGLAGDRASELPYAALAAQHFDAEHHEFVVPDAELAAHLPAVVACRDAPVSEPMELALYHLAREAARSGVKSVLTGEGGDELLAGAPRHVAERIGWPLASGDWRMRCVRSLGGLERDQSDRLAGPILNGARVLDTEPPFDVAPEASRLRRALYFEQTGPLPDHLLERSDRVTMAASIDARLPFLDHRLAELVSSLPDALRLRGLRTKWILRQAASGLVPKKIARRAKAALRLPVAEWLRGPMREQLLDHLQGASSCTRPYYRAGELDRVLGEHLKGRNNHQKLLWMLLNLEIWHRAYRPG